MQVLREDLIRICDQFLQNKISRQQVKDYAWELITSDKLDWDDDVIANTLFEWDNEDLNYPITKKNIKLWKQRLLTGHDALPENNT